MLKSEGQVAIERSLKISKGKRCSMCVHVVCVCAKVPIPGRVTTC